ncbi:sugar transferase [Streptococcus cristatus]|jgi:glycosyltransferase|uniref:sugar transferase n=1 Tax=Streptococcus cristatus TaxID=45634 RepID=UPI002001BB39|nr:sugar transferase [Streptococcus cristatus]
MIKFEDLPVQLRNEDVERYYKLLNNKRTSLFCKLLMDRLLALVLLILFSPVILIIGFWIKIDSSGPAIYKQVRITQYGREFKIWKFRTMVVGADKKGSLVTSHNDNRITKIGRFIRKYRIDELPQLVNVLLGDMSFVGTRPEVPKYTDQYTDEMKATLLLPAGITSPASISFKDEDIIINRCVERGLMVDDAYVNEVLPAKMHYNLEYLRQFSFINDLKIMIQTVVEVVR